jgi:Ca2+-binding EF-hand superfamily protein
MQGPTTLNAASKGQLQRFQNFQSIFQCADASGDGSLDVDEFIAAFTGGHDHNCLAGSQ